MIFEIKEDVWRLLTTETKDRILKRRHLRVWKFKEVLKTAKSRVVFEKVGTFIN